MAMAMAMSVGIDGIGLALAETLLLAQLLCYLIGADERGMPWAAA